MHDFDKIKTDIGVFGAARWLDLQITGKKNKTINV